MILGPQVNVYWIIRHVITKWIIGIIVFKVPQDRLPRGAALLSLKQQ